ncbi:hypothetical protein B0H34DRAFT_86391 [Crassisporium funariophilum]|nr:hypothetical protein B0H34DRAFT_86391 [Crassisporium funariophilum]
MLPPPPVLVLLGAPKMEGWVVWDWLLLAVLALLAAPKMEGWVVCDCGCCCRHRRSTAGSFATGYCCWCCCHRRWKAHRCWCWCLRRRQRQSQRCLCSRVDLKRRKTWRLSRSLAEEDAMKALPPCLVSTWVPNSVLQLVIRSCQGRQPCWAHCSIQEVFMWRLWR